MAHSDFSKIFVDRPILAAVLSLLVFLAGVVAIPNLPISEYPDVVPPSVQVTAIYPGANPKTIADTVAAPIEEAVNGVEGMIYMKSSAGSDGTMMLTVTFRSGIDIDLAAMQVQNRVAQAVPRLPEAVRQLGVTTVKSSPNITMVVHLVSKNGRYDGLYLSNFANLRVRDELARLHVTLAANARVLDAVPVEAPWRLPALVTFGVAGALAGGLLLGAALIALRLRGLGTLLH